MRLSSIISAQNVFLIGFALLPLIVVESSSKAFAEPKLAVLLFLSLVCVADLIRCVARGGELLVSPFQIGVALLLLLECPSFIGVENLGLMLTTLALQLSALVIAGWISNSEIKPLAVYRVAFLAVAVVNFGALAMILFRIPIFSDYAPFGSTIGLKNSLAVYLAQTLPLLLGGLNELRGYQGRYSRIARGFAGCLLVTLLWVVFASRARSAWWMIIFYLVALLVLAMWTRLERWRFLLASTGAAAAVAILLCYAVPGQLNWRSTTPYRDSISTLASLNHSSGRDKLWSVAITIIETHPWTGIGVGNYPALWHPYIPPSGVEAKEFAFIRNDLPLFNDYLQAGVEGGVLAMAAFVVTFLVLPILTLRRLSKVGEGEDISTALFSLCCVATALDALVDSPFNRPETLLNFAIAFGYLSRKYAWRMALQRGRKISALLSLSLVLLLIGSVFVRMAGSVLMRREWAVSGNVHALQQAWRFWPWSSQWGIQHIGEFRNTGNPNAVENFAEARLRSWPNDPESFLIRAKIEEERQRYSAAIAMYRRAVMTVPGGRCFRAGFLNYNELISRPDFPPTEPRLSEAELAQCR